MYGLDLNIIKLEITPYTIPNNRYFNKNTLMALSLPKDTLKSIVEASQPGGHLLVPGA